MATDPEAWVGDLRQPARGLVARAIVHHDDLELDPLLLQSARERGRKQPPTILGGDDDGHLGRARHRLPTSSEIDVDERFTLASLR